MIRRNLHTSHAQPLSAAEGLNAVFQAAQPVRATRVDLGSAVGRVLREPVCADRPLPPYDRAAMDGYAVRVKDCHALPVRLTSAGQAPAGQPFRGSVPPGGCVRIMTGGVVPNGLDAIVPIERVKVEGAEVIIADEPVKTGQHIHRQGSDARQSQVLLTAGHALRPVDIATLASVGVARPLVNRLIQVHLLATGSELVAVTQKPKPHQIRESNIQTLAAVLQAMPGVLGTSSGLKRDHGARLKAAIREALKGCDVLLTTGGVSAGDFDLVPEILADLDVHCVFHKLRIKPGKPLWFGVSKKRQLIFGLPGNPVSTLTTFHEFVLPALRVLMGQAADTASPQTLHLPLSEEIRKKTPLLEFARARLVPGQAGEYARVALAGKGGSGDFYSLTQSDGILVLPENEHEFEAGQVVEFHPWRFA